MFGFTLEVIFSVTGIERMLGYKLQRRVPAKYLEGFISLYMIPIHGLGLLFGFELVRDLTRDFYLPFRFLIWSVAITSIEVIGGFIYHKTVGFYSWDYYKESKYKIFKEGYSLWTLVPQWGIAGMILEQYVDLMRYLSPLVAQYFLK